MSVKKIIIIMNVNVKMEKIQYAFFNSVRIVFYLIF